MDIETILEKIKSNEYKEYFRLFGEKTGIELLCKKNITVNKMILDNQVNLMYYWYYKTNYKFIPDYVVMQNFPYNEIDNFLKNAKYWSRLMKIEEFSEFYEGREAMLKLAYIYGIFSNNTNSINHLEFLLTGIPRNLSKENYELLINVEKRIKDSRLHNLFFPTKEEIDKYYDIKYDLINENIITNKSDYIFENLYKSNDGETYSLQINNQLYPIVVSKIRNFMEIWGLEIILDPFKAYRIFKNLDMKYDEEFKNFLIENIDIILSNYEYSIYLPKIQKEFKNIKTLNSNRKLTYELAINYVKESGYNNVEVGNNKLSSIVSKVGIYNQHDFDIIQNIYNYGKIRIFSSIPRIEKDLGKYSYEILRLDDPLTLVIGTITDCCQKLYDSAEMCMEHSMVDNNGRLFIVRDKIGRIIAQSWIWRNKNVICFDSIEIPNKILTKIERKYGELARLKFVREIYEVYKIASEELLEIDNITYKNMLDNKLITEEEYNGLKLNKVTVGLGYNDIANVIARSSEILEINIPKPASFEPPVKLNGRMYLDDSAKQYILSKKQEIAESILKTLSIYTDDYKIYTDKNITKEDYKMFESLRMLTENTLVKLIDDSNFDENKIVSTIGEIYGVNKEKTKMIIHPNFAIIYVEEERNITILDMFFNTEINDNAKNIDIADIVTKQIELALLQITKNKKELDITRISLDKLNIIDKIQKNNPNFKKIKRI